MIDPYFTSLENCQPLQPHNYSAVYFLRRGEEVIYIGQSKSVVRRIANHIGKKSFDSILIMPVPADELSSVEIYWIKKLKPILNRTLGEMREHPPRSKHQLDPRRVQIRGKPYWQVSLGSKIQNGRMRRLRRTFANWADAEAFARLKKIEFAEHGAKSVQMSEQFKNDAIEAARLLAPTGNTLVECVNWWIQDQKAAKLPHSEAIRERLLLDLIAKGEENLASAIREHGEE
jgi:hypothetical protein